MKTKVFFMLCLLFGIGLTQLSAQNGRDTTGSVVYSYPNMGFYTDIWCNGVFVDYIVGEGTAHVVDHYKNNVWQWETVKFSGTATGLHGDIYTFSEIDKWNLPKQDVWIHSHLEKIHGSIMVPSGATFDFFGGRIRQAPKWIRDSGFEWFFRLTQDSKRLWTRYTIYNLLFFLAFLLQLVRIMTFDDEGFLRIFGWRSRFGNS